MSLEIIFLILLGVIMLISLIVGLIQGFKKNMYNFVFTIIFWVVFFVSAPFVTGPLIFENEQLYSMIGSILPPLDGASCKTLIDYVVAFLVDILKIDPSLFKEGAIENNIIAIAQCFIKFTYLFVLAFVLGIVKFLIYHIFFKRLFKVNKRKLRKLKKKNARFVKRHKKESKKLSKKIAKMEKRLKNKGKNTALGMLSGSLRGLLTCTLVLCVINSTVNLLPKLEKNDITASTQEEEKPINLYDFILSTTNNDPIVKMAVDMIADYQKSNLIDVTSIEINGKRADDLFIDSILSGKSKDYSFELRNEMSSIIQIAEKAFYVTNGFDMESVDFASLSELQVEYVQDILVILSDAALLNNLGSILVGTALSLDAVAPYMPKNLSSEEFKNIDWSSELKVIATLVADVYSLGNLKELNYLQLDTDQVKQIFNTMSELESINFLGHVASSYAFKSLVKDDAAYEMQIANIEETLADMALNGKYSDDIATFGSLYETFANIMLSADFEIYKDEDGKITNYLAALTSIQTDDYQLYKDLVSNILQTNFLTDIFPDVLVILKDKLIAKKHPELAAMINPSITSTNQWENEINTVIDIISQLTKGENGAVVPFEGIKDFSFKQLSNISVETILQSEVLSYAMIKLLIDTAKGESILTEDSSEINEMIKVPSYLMVDAYEDVHGAYRFHEKWYGKDGELDIMLSTLFKALSKVENKEYPVESLAEILKTIDPDLLTSSDVLYLSISGLLTNLKDFFVIPSSAKGDVVGKDSYVEQVDAIKRSEIKKILEVFTDENVFDLSKAYVYVNKVIKEDGTIEEVVIDKQDKTEDTIVLLKMDKMLDIITSDKLYDPNDPLEDGSNLSKLFSSEILRATLTNIITDMAGEFIVIPTNAIEAIQDCYLYEENPITNEKEQVVKQLGIIKVDQFKALIMAIRDLDIDLDTIKGDNPMVLIDSFKDEDGSLNDKVEPIFVNDGGINSKYSAILHATISKYVLDYSNGTDSVIKVPDAVKDNEGTLITGQEVVNLLNSVVILGNDILEGSIDDSMKDKIIEDIIETPAVLDSLIIRATLTNFVNGVDGVIIPESAIEESTRLDSHGYKAISNANIQELLDAIKVLKTKTNAASYLDIFNVNTLNIGTLSECSTVIGNSLILRATITEKLESIEQESNVIVIPSTAYEVNETFNEKYLSSTEVSAMFSSLTELFGESGSVEAINQMENIEVTKVKDGITLISSSDILRATITSNLKVSLDGQSSTINVLEDSVSKAKNNNGNDIVILTAQELNDIVNAIYTISSDGTLSFDLNLNTLFIVAAKSDVILASDMITLAISDYLIEGVNTPLGKLSYSSVMLSDPINSQNVVEIPSGSISNKQVLTKQQILDFIAKLQVLLP